MTFLKSAALVVCGFLALIIARAPADAATVTYDWTLTSPAASLGGFHFTGNGTLTATTGTGSYTVTGITGTVTDGTITEQITGLSTTGDNLLFPIGTSFTGPPITSGSYVSASNLDTTKGLAFTIAAGTIDLFGFFAPNATDVTPGNNYGQTSPDGFGVGTFALTATPLPAALPMFAGGLGLVGYLTRRRKRSGKQALAAA
jgi:hypothetical protein